MAVAVLVEVKVGALESTVMVRAAELVDALPEASVATAVIAMLPSESAADAGTVKLQLPSLFVVVEPSDEPSAKSSMELFASAVPVKVGVESLVRLSVWEIPLSDAVIRSGVDGIGGGVSSRSLTARDTDVSEVFPATSVAMTVKL